MKLGIISLGCPKNTVDTECMLSCLGGYSITTNPREADAILINTCAFLKSARDESRKAVSDMIKQRKKGAKVIVAGCFVSKDLKSLKKKYPAVHAWLGVNDMMNVGEALQKGGIFVSSKPFIYKGGQHTVMLNPYSAYVKISDGCNHTCSFCAIPAIKGRYRSRKVQDIAAEVRDMVGSGAREINLISQDLTCYGRDNYKKPMLIPLLKAILGAVKKNFWLRLMYLYPDMKVLPGIIEVMRADRRVCRYIDIPFQHVSDRVLKSMKRGYGKQGIMQALETLRKADGITVRSSFITGYPGETAAEFNELHSFISAGYVDKAGVFGYSDETGTAAHRLGGKMPGPVIEKRKNILTLASAEVYHYNNSRQLGKEQTVLITAARPGGGFLARPEGSAPDIDGYVTVKNSGKVRPGDFCRVRITGLKNNEPVGEVIGK
jgi:ribosomal protein S12 methylthiotransferase